MTKISVIVPNYNHEKFLTERLDSILGQTYSDIEVIILDDCSTDGSKKIIEQYRGHQKVKHVVYNEANSGSTFKQWKKGIELAQGEYIWIAESDDIAKSTFLEELIHDIQSEENIMLAFSQSTTDPKEFSVARSDYPVNVYTGLTFINQYMLTNPAIVNASAVIFKKSAVDPYILTEITQYKYAGDWLFWNHLLSKGKVIWNHKRLNFFRRHAASVAAKSDKSGLFIYEGFKLLVFVKIKTGISIPIRAIKVWASLWAQNYLLNKGDSYSSITTNCYNALLVSPLIFIFFLFYYIKFRWFATSNIKHLKLKQQNIMI
jgi:glycosyltransferase involved in cell wall biosynthesis